MTIERNVQTRLGSLMISVFRCVNERRDASRQVESSFDRDCFSVRLQESLRDLLHKTRRLYGANTGLQKYSATASITVSIKHSDPDIVPLSSPYLNAPKIMKLFEWMCLDFAKLIPFINIT